MSAKIKNRTIKRKDLREKIHSKLPHINRGQSDKITDEVFEAIIEGLIKSELVKLREFGVFKVHHKKERMGRNPMTGIEAVIAARRSVTFVPSPVLIAKVNGEDTSNLDDDAE